MAGAYIAKPDCPLLFVNGRPRLVAIPAGYAIGAWIGTLAAFIAGLDREARTDLRDQIGVAGGTVGLTVWLLTSILMD